MGELELSEIGNEHVYYLLLYMQLLGNSCGSTTRAKYIPTLSPSNYTPGYIRLQKKEYIIAKKAQITICIGTLFIFICNI